MRTLIFSAALLVLCLMLSCVSPAEYVRRTVDVAPSVADDIPRLVANPADFGAWFEVAKALGYIIVGAGGKAGVDAVRKKRVA